MLRKLLKYDLRANMKLFLFIWPAMLLLAGLQRLLLELPVTGFLGRFFMTLLTGLMILTMIAVVVLCFVICVVRFYSGLLRREGYLMFTLPVKPWQLLVSKLLAAMVTLIPTCIFAYFGIALILSGAMDGVWNTMFNFSQILDQPLSAGTLILAGLTVVAVLANVVLRVYFVSCLGHLFRRARIFLSILFYYLIGVLMQIASMMTLTSVNYEPNTFFNSIFTWVESLSFNGAMSAFFGAILLINAAIGCVYFFVSEVILRKRLNLE